MRTTKEGVISSTTVVYKKYSIDMITAVKELNKLSSEELNRLIRKSGNCTIRHVTEDGQEMRLDTLSLARFLGLHLTAVLISWKQDYILLEYMLSGIRLLHSLCDLAAKHSKFEQTLLDNPRISDQLLNLVFHIWLSLATYGVGQDKSDYMISLHSTLLASSLHLLTVFISPLYHELAQVLNAFKRCEDYMEAAFTAVRVDVRFLQTKLSAERADSTTNNSQTAEETVKHLCLQCEASLQFLHSICQQKLLQERLVKNQELCGGAVLLLSQAVLELKISPSLEKSSLIVAAVSRLKSKALSILLHLCEAENLSYLDVIAGAAGTSDLAKSVALEVLKLLKEIFASNDKLSNSSSDGTYSKGQLQLNAMRLVDIFSDDSNFRSYITLYFTEVLAMVFSLPYGDFLSSWCSSDLPIWEEDTMLEYDPFAAAGWTLSFFSFSDPSKLPEIKCNLTPSKISRASYAHQRTSLLVKVIANLHCFVPDICKEEKDLFLNKFVNCLQNLPTLEGSSPILGAEIEGVSKNLGSLLSHAESLTPVFLNEEDVQLLRVFISQFKSQVASTEDQMNQVQVEEIEEKLFDEDLLDGSKKLQVFESIKDSWPHWRKVQMKCMLYNIATAERNQRIGKDQPSKLEKQGCDSDAVKSSREFEKQTPNIDSSASDSSLMHEKCSPDQAQVEDVEKIKGSGPPGVQDDDKIEAIQYEEKQQRKRKRTLMNDQQISLLEKALKDEPDMHRNASLLKQWADKLSVHGSEVSASQLKNWLNNRKAKLARAAKDGYTPSEGDTTNKQSGPGIASPANSPLSPTDDHVSSTSKGIQQTGSGHTELKACANDDLVSLPAAPSGATPLESFKCEPGQYTVLLDDRGMEIGKGNVYQVHGYWNGKNLDESGTSVVDIIELRAVRSAKLPYPSLLVGMSFEQAEKRFGTMRVLWDRNKLHVPRR